MRFTPTLCPALVLLLISSGPIRAQTILGELVDEAGNVAAGAYVALEDRQSNELDAYLSDRAGAFIVQAPAPGRYRLRIERIGHTALLTPFLELAAGEPLAYRFELPAQPVDLARLGPSDEPECVGDPEAAFATSRLWNEVRKALANTVWTDQWAPLLLKITRYMRDLEPESRLVELLESDSWVQTGAQTLASLPASELAADGYVREEPDGSYAYYAPDPQVLLSPDFIGTHCYSVRAGEGPESAGWVGLAFEPVAGRESPDLSGVFWVDPATAELRRVLFQYTTLPFTVSGIVPGGRIDLRPLSTGAWIVGSWQIRLPVLSSGEDARLLAIREVGIEVTAAQELDGPVLVDDPQSVLLGTVIDAADGSPIRDAVVRLAGTEHADTTDAAGRFRIEELLEGTYSVTASRADLEALGFVGEPQTVHLTRGSQVEMQLDVPGPATALGEICPEADESAAVAAVVGIVRDSLSGVPLPGADVVARWSENTRAQADETGRYRFCRLPPDVQLSLEAQTAGRVSSRVSVRSPDVGRLLLRDLLIALASEEGIVTEVIAEGGSGPARLVGRVVDAQTLSPIEAVDVRIESLGLQRLTDNEGRFVFQRVERGSHELLLDHLAYGTRTDTLLVSGGEILGVEVRLAMRPIELAPLTVILERQPLPPKMRGFYERMDRGSGNFITRQDIEKRQPGRVSHMVGDLPGVRMIYLGAGQYMPLLRNAVRFVDGVNLGPCPPEVYLDGIPLAAGEGGYVNIDDFVLPIDVEAVEVYKSPGSVPARFGGSTAGCGVIVIWTRTF